MLVLDLIERLKSSSSSLFQLSPVLKQNFHLYNDFEVCEFEFVIKKEKVTKKTLVVQNLEAMVLKILDIMGLSLSHNVTVKLGIDKGRKSLKFMLSIVDLNESEDVVHKSSGVKKSFCVVYCHPDVEESNFNFFQIFQKNQTLGDC